MIKFRILGELSSNDLEKRIQGYLDMYGYDAIKDIKFNIQQEKGTDPRGIDRVYTWYYAYMFFDNGK